MNCPCCNAPMVPKASAGGYAPPGFDAKDDHWWCDNCAEAYDFDDPELEQPK